MSDISKIRDEYKTVRAAACYDNGATFAQFDAAARAIAGANASPERWLRAAKSVSMRCERCSGTGAYITGTVNGRPTGPGGQCFRCQGRGAQTWEDGIRNRHHDMHAAVREMFAA